MPRILVIANEETIRNGLKQLLVENGCTVFVAESGKAGLKISQKKNIDIVITDMDMPEMDGIEMLRRIKKSSPKSDAIVTVRHDNKKAALDALKAGAFDCIIKPVNYKRLCISIHRALEKQALLKRLIQSERLKALGEMASGIAHNINNILTIVLGHIRLLQSKPEDKQVLQDAINIISKSAWDGAQLIRKLQDFSRSSPSGEKFVPVDINYILRESIEFTKLRWKDEAQFHNVHYDIKCHNLTDAVLVSGNPVELREAFVNITNNAIDAMPEGGELSFSTKLNGNKVLVSIADSGCGINEKHRKKLFEPFFTTKCGKGTGLGLSTALAVVTEHKGAIKVKSVVGKGSEFIIKLPVISNQGRDAMHCVSTIPIDGTKAANVLVVDDEKEICTIVAKILTGAGHRVSTAQAGKDGIRLFKKGRFDLVLCDMTMQDMSGWEVARAIYNLESQKTHKTPIVIFTGWGDTFDPAKLAKTGVKAVISKPLDNSQLLDIVRQTVQNENQKSKTKNQNACPRENGEHTKTQNLKKKTKINF